MVSFISTIQTLIIILSIFFLMKYLTILFIFGILILICILILIYNIKFISNNISIIIIGVCSLLLVSIIFWIPLYDIILTSPLQGDVTIDIDNIYYRNDSPIPLSIQTTGPNSGIRIFLYNKERDSYFLTDHIYLESKHNLSTTKYGTNSIWQFNGKWKIQCFYKIQTTTRRIL